MRLPPRAFRRTVVDPLWLPIAAVSAALLLLVAVAGALVWPFDRGVRLSRLALLAVLYLALNSSLLAACTGLWLRHPAAARRNEQQWQQAHAGLLRWALSSLRSAAVPLLGFRTRLEEPPDVARLAGRPILVLARHAGPGDSFTLVELLLSRYHRIPRIVLKETLQWDPGLDVLLNRLSACFLPASGAARADLPERLSSLARSLRGEDAMLIFPEGRNWTPHRYRRAVARLRRRVHEQAAADAAEHPNVLPPRPAGVLACLAARPELDVVVVAHTGLEDLVSAALVWRALPLWDRPMTVRWWYVDAHTVPADPAEQYAWLRDEWAHVDSWVGARKAESGLPARPAGQNGDDPDGILGRDSAAGLGS